MRRSSIVVAAGLVGALLGGWSVAGAACVPSATKICIDDAVGDKRFEAAVTFSTVLGGGQSGAGQAIPLSTIGVTRGGLFWFFAADNPEMQVKVLNGCGVNGYYWVYLTAGTNVGYTATVTDTLRAQTRTYVNPDLTAALPVQEITAFSCN